MIPFQTLLAENAPFLGTFVQSAAPEFLEASAYGIDTILMYQKCCEIQQAVFGRSAQ